MRNKNALRYERDAFYVMPYSGNALFLSEATVFARGTFECNLLH